MVVEDIFVLWYGGDKHVKRTRKGDLGGHPQELILHLLRSFLMQSWDAVPSLHSQTAAVQLAYLRVQRYAWYTCGAVSGTCTWCTGSQSRLRTCAVRRNFLRSNYAGRSL